MQNFKIFYSWQSDLPNNRAKSFIRECIDEAVDLAQETEAIEAVRDEATLGTTGSPNIVTTLFSKIDECDLFIADISLCYTENKEKKKKSPNPNVLLELGYAVKTLGWDRVVCLCNIDYGNEYPFDIAQNRITNYSLKGKNRNEVKTYISKIIYVNIRDLRKQRPRAKKDTSTHIVGTYDFEKKIVENHLTSIDIKNQESFILHNNELIDEASQLLIQIQELTNQVNAKYKRQDNVQDATEMPAYNPINLPHTKAIRLMSESLKESEVSVIWEEKENDKIRIRTWLDAEVDDDFFALGGLKKVTQQYMQDSFLKGSEEEKNKYSKLQELSYILLLLEIRSNYLKTFEGMCFIPLAIQNISTLEDENIRIVISIESGEIVEPDEHLIWKEYEGLQRLICRNDEDDDDVGLICELFNLKEDGNIHIEYSPDSPSKYIPKTPILTSNGFMYPDKTEEDYKNELEEFIASTEGRGYYEFYIENLRPNECRWFSYGLLIKPVDNTIIFNYQIHSAHSTGYLQGTLEYHLE